MAMEAMHWTFEDRGRPDDDLKVAKLYMVWPKEIRIKASDSAALLRIFTWLALQTDDAGRNP